MYIQQLYKTFRCFFRSTIKENKFQIVNVPFANLICFKSSIKSLDTKKVINKFTKNFILYLRTRVPYNKKSKVFVNIRLNKKNSYDGQELPLSLRHALVI